MSSNEQVTSESKSSIAVSQNSKGEAQVAVKVYDGAEAAELERLRQLAITTYKATVAAVRS